MSNGKDKFLTVGELARKGGINKKGITQKTAC